MKFLYIFIAFFAINFNSSASLLPEVTSILPDVPQVISQPIFGSDNLRNKKLFNTSFGVIYQLNTYKMSSLGAIAIPNAIPSVESQSVINSNNVGINAELTLNITSKAWIRLYGDGVWGVGKNSISPGHINSTPNSDPKYSNFEVKAVVGYDILSYGIMDLSLYGGLFHKSIYLNSSTNIIPTPGAISTSNTNISTNYTGAVFGTELTLYTTNMVSKLYAEGYLTQVYGTMDSTTTSSAAVFNSTSSTNYVGSAISGGFGVGASTEIEVINNVWLKPSIKYQMLFANGISIAGKNASNGLDFQALTTGLAISWR